jgi:probable FeS assembly SUF system protein SufT
MKRLREAVTIGRAVSVECVPDGTPFEVPAGTPAQLVQALGQHFTLDLGGQLVRLKGTDADAIGRAVPTAPAAKDGAAAPADLQELVWQTLRGCYDPEIPVNIVELGLIYDCTLTPMDDGQSRVAIRMTLTAPGCGMGELLTEEVADQVLALPGVGEVRVDMVFDPPWNLSRMSEAARLTLGM